LKACLRSANKIRTFQVAAGAGVLLGERGRLTAAHSQETSAKHIFLFR
jgi:hypothetical protein